MTSTGELLESVRDVQEPPPPEATPLWLPGVNLLLLIIIILLGWHLLRHWRTDWRTRVIRDLRQAHELPPQQAINSAATLLRQLMIARGQPAHTVHGDQWLQLLDQHFDTQWFSREEGQLLGDALYRPVEYDPSTISALLEKLEEHIRALPLQSIKDPDSK